MLQLFKAAFLALKSANAGEVSLTDIILARHYKCFLRHMLYLETPYSAYIMLHIVKDNRGVLDSLMFRPPQGQRSGLDEILGVMIKNDGGVVNNHYFDLLSVFCVCGGLSVTRGQATVFQALESLPRDSKHLFRLSITGGDGETMQPLTMAPKDVLPLWLSCFGTVSIYPGNRKYFN